MGSERLIPFEMLEKDYYLGERNGWYSDGEQKDSESSDDELREELSKLSGVRCESRKGIQYRKTPKTKDEFESNMDHELDESFVAHTSKMFSSPRNVKTEISEDKGLPTDDDIPALIGDTDVEMEAESSSSYSVLQEEAIVNNDSASSARSKVPSDKPSKSVTFSDETMVSDQNERSGDGRNSRSSFDDKNIFLRKAESKATKEEIVEFYDSDEDEDNERWVRQHRELLKIVKPQRRSPTGSDCKENVKTKGQKDQNGETDAVLSCPACMSLLTRDCQRHDLYRDQYRAVFVENCNVITNEVLFLPQSGKNNRKTRRNAAGIKPNTIVVDPVNVATLPKEDLFHPVQCSVCATNVGVYDCEEVYHFFNVLSGYA